MKIALVTSDEEKDWYEDIELVIKSLRINGAQAEQVIWDMPNIDWASYDIVCIDSTWNYTEKLEEFLRWCDKISTTSKLVNSSNIVKLSSNKRYLLTLADAGITIPPSHILTAATPIPNELASKFTGKVIVKPVVGANGVGACLFDNFALMLQSPTFTNMLAEQDMIVQTYIPDIETSGELGAIFISGELSHCVIKMPSGDDFRVQYQYGGVTTLVEAPDYAQDLYEQIISILAISPTYMRLDFIPAETPIVMEVEMVEPNKYFSLYPHGAELLARALMSQN